MNVVTGGKLNVVGADASKQKADVDRADVKKPM